MDFEWHDFDPPYFKRILRADSTFQIQRGPIYGNEEGTYEVKDSLVIFQGEPPSIWDIKNCNEDTLTVVLGYSPEGPIQARYIRSK